MTKENEALLRNEGATDELIEVIRQNLPPVSKPIQTPTVKLTPKVNDKKLKNSIGMEFVFIPAGSFMMGSPTTEERDNDETLHPVTISKDFYLGKYEVTQAQWRAVMKTTPSKFKDCENCPVEQVSWEDAQKFLKKLNAKNDETYRLPTEAEWEYAARAGTTTAFAFGDSLSSNKANFDGNSPYGNEANGKYLEKTVLVGSYQPNAWGLYDMHGNVWEWCEDWYGVYESSAQTDPTGVSLGSLKVVRGGGWFDPSVALRSANRGYDSPSRRSYDSGFRVVRN